jgi:hypothetical protein
VTAKPAGCVRRKSRSTRIQRGRQGLWAGAVGDDDVVPGQVSIIFGQAMRCADRVGGERQTRRPADRGDAQIEAAGAFG